MPPEWVQVNRMYQRRLPRTRRVREVCRLSAWTPQRRVGRPEPARSTGEPAMGGFDGARTGKNSPRHGRLMAAIAVRAWSAGAWSAGAGPGEDGTAGCRQTVSGHDDVGRPCPGHRAPTASVDTPISFTYHLPLCRSTTDILYVIASFDVISRFPEADPG